MQEPRTQEDILADCYAAYCMELMDLAGQQDTERVAALRQEIAHIQQLFKVRNKDIYFSPVTGDILIGRLPEH